MAQLFSGGRFAPAPLCAAEQAVLQRLEGHTLDHPAMPDAVRLEVPDWLLPTAPGSAALAAEIAALLEPAPLDLRVNLLKTTREEARAALAAEGLEADPTPLSPWGLRIEGRRQVTTGAGIPRRAGRDPGRGQPACRAARRCAAGDAGGRSCAPARAARRWRWR